MDITFKKGVLNGTRKDFDEVYKRLYEEMGFKNKTQAKNWLREEGLTPHHLSDTVIQLVPTNLHGNIPHIGSASEMRKGVRK